VVHQLACIECVAAPAAASCGKQHS